MSDDREKLLRVMNNLESDYKSGKISAEKYSYFRSKYEDKLNSIDARDATKRIRSMQGKPSTDTRKKRNRRPTKNKKKEEQDLVQKYIINPKKSDAKYNKKEKSSMDSGTFKLLLLLILVVGFTAGTAYGIFNFDFGSITQSDTVAVVDDTAFPEFKADVKPNTTQKYMDTNKTSDEYKYEKVETTTDTPSTTTTTTASNTHDTSSNSNTHQDSSQSSDSGSSNNQGGGSSTDSGNDNGGSKNKNK
jgi:hypothetical protein